MCPTSPSTQGPGAAGRAASKRATRRALIRAAHEAFAEEGLEAPSLDAICARAGFTRGAFYVHFHSRDDLVAAVMEETLRELVDGVVAAGGGARDLEEAVTRYTAVARFLRHQGAQGAPRVPFHQVLQAARRAPHIAALLRRVVAEARNRLERAARRAQAEGRVNERAEPAELAVLLLLAALGVIAAEELEIPFDPEAAGNALLRLLASGDPPAGGLGAPPDPEGPES